MILSFDFYRRQGYLKAFMRSFEHLLKKKKNAFLIEEDGESFFENLKEKKLIPELTGKCTNCQECSEICPTGALSFESKKFQLNLKKCIACGECLIHCPEKALSPTTKISYVDIEKQFEIEIDLKKRGKDHE